MTTVPVKILVVPRGASPIRMRAHGRTTGPVTCVRQTRLLNPLHRERFSRELQMKLSKSFDGLVEFGRKSGPLRDGARLMPDPIDVGLIHALSSKQFHFEPLLRPGPIDARPS